MKFFSLVTLFAAALVSAETQQDISWQESEAWHGCAQSLVNEFDQGKTGDVPPCNLWDCLHKQASHYDRGGAITTMSNILSPTCVAARLSSGGLFGTHKPGPPASFPELLAWDDCMSELIEEFEKGDDGSRSACNLWVCLHNNAATYQRGGLLTTASNLVDPICTAVGIVIPK